MPSKHPVDFDADWYLETYPDVSQTGLPARDHYRRFGRSLGRKPAANLEAGAPLAGSAPVPDTPLANALQENAAQPNPSTPQSARPLEPPAAQLHQLVATAAGNGRTSPIIARPAGLEAAPHVPMRTLPGFSLDPCAQEADQDELKQPLIAYALLTDRRQDHDPRLAGHISCCTSALSAGPARIQSAWLPGGNILRLMISGVIDGVPNPAQGWILQAWQADPDNLVAWKPTGATSTLPPAGPLIHDVNLRHSLMPVLLHLRDAAGRTRGLALLPFPSLLPGGLHAVEASARLEGADPMQGIWLLSDELLRERAAPSGPLVGEIAVRIHGATGAEAIFSPEVHDWLEAIFGLNVKGLTSSAAPTLGEAALLSDLGVAPPEPDSDLVGFRLEMPRDGLPSLSVLMARATGTSLCGVGPFLIAEEGSLRPRWSVVPAIHQKPDYALPMLLRPKQDVARTSVQAAKSTGSDLPLAILLRPAAMPHPTRMLMPMAPDALRASPPAPPFSLLIEATDSARTTALLALLSQQGAAEILVRLDGSPPEQRAELRAALDQHCGTGRWTEIVPGSGLPAVARGIRHDLLLTTSDRVAPHDPRTLPLLAELLLSDSANGSVACTLLGEQTIRKQTELQPISGGLFPSRVSFLSSPRLGFAEPDTWQALAGLTYPVAANSLRFTLWRREVLIGLPYAAGPVSAMAHDLQLGLDLIMAGFRNLCTDRIRAGLAGPMNRRDMIDPLGASYLQPRLWQEVLPQVTLLRELF